MFKEKTDIPSKIITTELKQELVSFYQKTPMTINTCAKKFKLSNVTIMKILNEFNIPRYKKAQVYNPLLCENYFQNIDNEHKAYWLGFLITDGNIYIPKDGRQASISISQTQDRQYILEQFLLDVHANTKIGHDGRGTCLAAIRSNIMAKDLEKYGLRHNKTLYTYLPEINNELLPHLIRGILDGDGNITSTKTSKNKHKHAISFCGTHKLMDDIGDIISTQIGIFKPKIYDYKDRHLSEIKWQSITDCFKLGEWLYSDATIYIKDKYEKYKNFTNYYQITR